MVAADLGGLGVVEAAGGKRDHKEGVASFGALDDLRYFDVADNRRVLHLGRNEQNSTRCRWICKGAADLILGRGGGEISGVLPGRYAVIVLCSNEGRRLSAAQPPVA